MDADTIDDVSSPLAACGATAFLVPILRKLEDSPAVKQLLELFPLPAPAASAPSAEDGKAPRRAAAKSAAKAIAKDASVESSQEGADEEIEPPR